MKPKKDTKQLLFENMAKLNSDFKLNEELLQERLVTHSTEIHQEISKIPNLKRLNLWSTASSMVGLYRYEPDKYAYEIEIRPVEIGKYKDLWGNQIKKREDRVEEDEDLAKIGDTPKPKLESKLHVKPSDIPPQIIEWAKSIVGSGFQNNITVQKSNGFVEIRMPWHDADKETHQYFKLADNGAVAMGSTVSKSGWSEVNMGDKYGKTPIPSGYVLATVGTYPKRLRIVTNTDAMNIIPDNSALNKLSDEALVALYQAKSFKPFYRQKFGDSVYQELISSGLMNSQKAITIDGKNLINSPEVIERLRNIQEKDRKENGWNGKYRLSNI